MFKKKKKRIQTVSRKLLTNLNPLSIVPEQYRTVRTNINFSMPDKELRTLLITSASPGDGKSTTAANIAISFAQEGKKVVLIDADLRKPTMHYTFHTSNSPGLSNLLTRQWEFDDVVNITEVSGMHLITSGQIPSNPAELLSSNAMNIFIEDLKTKYDIIILDAPPVLTVADAQILSNKCDGTILVINAGTTLKGNIIQAKKTLENSNANLIGTVLNNFELKKEHHYYQYYGANEHKGRIVR